jgi:DNA invertase Pin-like site-specific DNA recombinase
VVKPLSLEINVTWEFLMRVGYRRVSTIEQNLDRQDLGVVERVFEDRASGKDKEREQLQGMLSFVRKGDEVVVYSIDRLARDLRDLQSIITQLNEKGVSIEFLSERLVFSGNSDDAFAKLQLQMMGAFAEFERNMIRKRQAEGIAKAKERGVYKNRKRKRKVSEKRIFDLKQEGLNNTEIANYLGISRMTVHRSLNR